MCLGFWARRAFVVLGLRCEVSEFMAMLRDSFRVVVMLELGPGRYEAASVFKLSKLLECNSGVVTLPLRVFVSQ